MIKIVFFYTVLQRVVRDFSCKWMHTKLLYSQ